jgi:ParB family chromosome partitioning protein
VVQPILVRPLAEDRFLLIAGERRWLASKIAGKTTVPAILRTVSDEQALEITIVENLQRADLNPMEQARAFERLARDFKLTQDQIAARTGKDRTTISNFMRLLRLPPEVQDRVEQGELSFGHARALLALESQEEMLLLARSIASMAMSVRQTEALVQGRLRPETNRGERQASEEVVDPNVREAQERLQQALGLKVRIDDRNGRGRVVIEYGGLEDFDTLLTAIIGD